MFKLQTNFFFSSLLCGSPAFHDKDGDVDKIQKKILKGDFSLKYLERVSDEAKDLVQKLLTVKASKRPTPDEAFDHPWLKDPEVIRQYKALTGMQPGDSIFQLEVLTN